VNVIKVALDFCVPKRVTNALNELYGERGYKFQHLDTIVDKRAKDVMWADVYKRWGGRVIISGDPRIAYRPLEAVAFIDNGFMCFFPGGHWCQLKEHEKMAALVYWWPCIEERIQAIGDGTCWRVPFRKVDGVIQLGREKLEPLTIPPDVLQKARNSGQTAEAA
jgi:hypothetical protein